MQTKRQILPVTSRGSSKKISKALDIKIILLQKPNKHQLKNRFEAYIAFIPTSTKAGSDYKSGHGEASRKHIFRYSFKTVRFPLAFSAKTFSVNQVKSLKNFSAKYKKFCTLGICLHFPLLG